MSSTESRKTRFHKISANYTVWLDKHPFLDFILVKSIGVWFPFLYSFLGDTFYLVKNANGTVSLTWFGWLLVGFVAVFIAISHLMITCTRRSNGELLRLQRALDDEKDRVALLATLKNSKTKICKSKLSTLENQLAEMIVTKTNRPPEIISNPKRQLEIIAEELSRVLCDVLRFDNVMSESEPMYTSILYRFPGEDKKWYWATPQRGLSIEQLFEINGKRKSTLRALLDDREHTLFFNNKQDAYEKEKYFIDDVEDVFDDIDGKKVLKGSIACYQHQIKINDKAAVEFVISVVTYHRRLVELDATTEQNKSIIKNVKNNIERNIIPTFADRIKIELCLLYLKELHEKRVLNP